MELLRTPEDRFEGLPGYPFEAHHVELRDGVRVHYVDEGPRDAAETLLLLHGEPTWSYLYRKMIPPLAEAGHRVVVPDLVGFGKSDKPARREDHTYRRHVDWTWEAIEAIGLDGITLFGQDWGGLIGLVLAAFHPERFRRVVASNTALPPGRDVDLGKAFEEWRRYSQEVPEFPVARIVGGGGTVMSTELSDAELAAYDAPFPDESYKEGARQFPALVPESADDPASAMLREAWESLVSFDRPFLTAFGDSDPITGGIDRFLQEAVPGARGQPHVTIEGAGHFVQEDAPERLVEVILDFVDRTP